MKKFVIWTSIIMVISLGAGITVMICTADFNFERHQTIEEQHTSLEGTTTISIHSISDDIRIVRTDSVELKAELKTYYQNTNTKSRLSVERDQTARKVNIETPKNLKLSFFDINWSSELTVYIPKTFTGKLEVDSISANVVADGLGDIQSIKIDTTSGDVTVNKVEGEVGATSVSGDVNVSYTVFIADVKIKTTSGDVKLDLPSNPSCKFNFNTTSGDLANTIGLAVSSKRGHFEGKQGDEKYTIVVDTISGDLELK